MLTTKHIVVGVGELLWDLLPAGKQLGGGPANFAYITSLLGDEGIPASRLGLDSRGAEAIHRLGELGLSTEFIQTDAQYPTGTVVVEVTTPANRGLKSPSLSPGIFSLGRRSGRRWQSAP